MTLLTNSLLGETAVSVLADCAFLMLDSATEPVCFEADAVETHLSFSGPAGGTLWLRASRQLLQAATADMLGAAPDEPGAAEDVEATLRELANVLLGVLLARAFGSVDCPVIGLPESGPLRDGLKPSAVICSASLQDLEGRPFVASILAAAEGA